MENYRNQSTAKTQNPLVTTHLGLKPPFPFHPSPVTHDVSVDRLIQVVCVSGRGCGKTGQVFGRSFPRVSGMLTIRAFSRSERPFRPPREQRRFYQRCNPPTTRERKLSTGFVNVNRGFSTLSTDFRLFLPTPDGRSSLAPGNQVIRRAQARLLCLTLIVGVRYNRSA